MSALRLITVAEITRAASHVNPEDACLTLAHGVCPDAVDAADLRQKLYVGLRSILILRAPIATWQQISVEYRAKLLFKTILAEIKAEQEERA